LVKYPPKIVQAVREELAKRSQSCVTYSTDPDHVIVHLVHGTWPDGIRAAMIRWLKKTSLYPTENGSNLWFQTGHKFRKGLEEALASKADIRPFIWSGANSFRARSQAAANLVPHLAEGIHKHIRQVIIAHSHGGNVAMLALQLMAKGFHGNALNVEGTLLWVPWQSRSARLKTFHVTKVVDLSLEQMKNGVRQIELVTLATPFLRVENLMSSQALFYVFMVCFIVLWIWATLFLTTLFGAWLFLLAFVGVLGLCFPIMAIFDKAKVYMQNEVVKQQSIRFYGKRIQCIRGISDEADMGISLGIIGCSLIRAMLMLFVPHRISDTYSGTILQLLAAIAWVLVFVLYAWDAKTGDPIPWWLNFGGLIAAGVFMFMTLACLLQGALGIELARAGLSFLTTVESSPDAVPHQIEIVTLTPPVEGPKRLRHSIYLHPDCIPTILAGL
jgi:hypothetical protein